MINQKTITLKSSVELEDVIVNYVEEKMGELLNGFKDFDGEYVKCETAAQKLMVFALNDLYKYSGLFSGDLVAYVLVNQDVSGLSKKSKIPILFTIESTKKQKTVKFAIEIMKSPDENTNDRNRKLMLNGYEVINFSESEVLEDPDKCAYEIMKIANSIFRS